MQAHIDISGTGWQRLSTLALSHRLLLIELAAQCGGPLNQEAFANTVTIAEPMRKDICSRFRWEDKRKLSAGLRALSMAKAIAQLENKLYELNPAFVCFVPPCEDVEPSDIETCKIRIDYKKWCELWLLPLENQLLFVGLITQLFHQGTSRKGRAYLISTHGASGEALCRELGYKSKGELCPRERELIRFGAIKRIKPGVFEISPEFIQFTHGVQVIRKM